MPEAVFLDANVLLEIVLDRANAAVARRFLEQLTDKPAISALTAHLVVHFGQEIVELPIVRHFLQDYTMLPLEAADFAWAFANTRSSDVEDALQLAVAIRHGYDSFLTLDKRLAKSYSDLPNIKVRLLGK